VVGLVRLTYGLELEWSDVDRHAALPVGDWSTTDYTIVNSDGHANDPTGKRHRWGGEINTEPTGTIGGQIEQVAVLAAALNPTINYRSNLHVHVGIDPLDVDVAKRLLQFISDWQDAVYALVEPIPSPAEGDYQGDMAAFRGAMKRHRRRKVSHQHRLPAVRCAEALRATTMRDFYEAHAPLGRNGHRAWNVAPRPGMNTRSLWKHGTIEFRHFPGSANPDEIGEALRWCGMFTDCALIGSDPCAAYRAGEPWQFPLFHRYEHALEVEYQRTKYG
jgi:hypothetical protein